MPLILTTRSRSKKFSPSPAADRPTQPVSLLPPRIPSPVREIGDRRIFHAPALPLFVLVKRRPAMDPASGGVESGRRGAQRTFSPSVLVKRVGPPSVFLASIFTKPHCPTRVSETLPAAQRARGHWWSWRHAGTKGRTCWARMAGQLKEARQIVLVKSFSSPCNAPLRLFGNPDAVAALNGWRTSYA